MMPAAKPPSDAGDRHQSVDRGIVDGVLRDLAVEQGQIFRQPVKLADVPIDRRALIVRQRLGGQPRPAAAVEKIGMRALRDQVRVQDRMHLVLEPRAMAHDLVAPRHQPTLAFRLRVRRPDLRQVPSRLQTGERAGIDLVGLDVSLGDRLHLQRIGDNHPCHERCQNPRYRHAVAGRLDHHLITGQQGLAKSLQRSPRHINAARMSEPAILPKHHLPESSVDVDANHPSHLHLLLDMTGAAGDTTTTDSRSQRNRASRRGGQLLTRARGSSYASACPHIVLPVPLSRWSHHTPRRRTPQRNVGTEKSHTGYQPHRKHLRHRSPPHHPIEGLPVQQDGTRDGLQTARGRAEKLASSRWPQPVAKTRCRCDIQ
ncbi:hypothetical protein ACVWXL_000522 [Bradyrhizobium sp. GM22.5]